MVAIEKAGIPAVGIVAQDFVRAWQSCVEGWGQPSTAFVTIPHATTGQQAGFIRTMVDAQTDAIIRGLTRFPLPREQSEASRAVARPPRSSRWRWMRRPRGWMP